MDLAVEEKIGVCFAGSVSHYIQAAEHRSRNGE